MNALCHRLHAQPRTLAGLAALCALAYAPAIVGMLFGWWPLGEDALAYFAPLRGWAAGQLRGGTIPLWNPYLFCGQPLAANIQTALWYPPNIVYWLLPSNWAVLLDALGHTVWLAWGGYVFARALGLRQQAAFLAAVLLALGGSAAARAYAGQIIWLAAFAHLPWLLRAELCFLRDGRTRTAAIAGAWLGLLVLAGHPPTALLAVLLMCALAAVWAATRGKGERRMPRRLLPGIGAFGAMAILLSAVAWLPFRELTKLAEHGGALSFSDATVLSGSWKSLVRLLAPDWFGGNRGLQWSQTCCSHEETASLGVYGLVLAVMAGWFAWRAWRSTPPAERSARGVFFVLAALPFVFLLAMGANTPFYGWFFGVFPPLRVLRVPSRWLLVWAFVAPFLAAWAWDSAFGRGNEKLARVVLAALRGVALLGAAAAAWALLSPEGAWQQAAAPFGSSAPGLRGNEIAANFRRAALLESAVVFLLAGLAASLVERWQRASPELRPKAARMLVAFACLECLLGFWRGAKLVSPKDQTETFWPREILARYRPGERWTTSFFWPGINHAAPGGVPIANGYDPLGTKSYFAFASAAEGRKFWETLYQPSRRSPLWRVAGVTHTLAQTRDPLDGETPYPDTRGWKLEAKSGRWELWNRNEAPWPRVYLAAETWEATAPLQWLEHLAGERMERERAGGARAPAIPVVIGPGQPLKAAWHTLTWSKPSAPGAARVAQETPNRLSLEASSSRLAALVVADANYPGWRAWVDGREMPVVTANGMFRAVQVQRGKSAVQMVFEPQTVRLGIFFSLCGLVVFTALSQVRPGQALASKDEHESDSSA